MMWTDSESKFTQEKAKLAKLKSAKNFYRKKTER